MAICEERRAGAPWAESTTRNEHWESRHQWAAQNTFPEDAEDDVLPDPDWFNTAALAIRKSRLVPADTLRNLYRVVLDCLAVLVEDSSRITVSRQLTLPISPALTLASDHRKVDFFLDEVYSLSDKGQIHSAGDRIFDFVQDLLKSGDFPACSSLLRQVAVERLKPTLMLTFLSTTLAAKHRLATARGDYFSRVLDALTRVRGEERAKKLLSNLR